MNKGITSLFGEARFYYIVPFAMELVGPQMDSLHFFIGDFASSGYLRRSSRHVTLSPLAVVGGCAFGNSSCRSSQTKRASLLRSVIFHPAPANGTRSNTASFLSSLRTGVANLYGTTKRLFNSLRRDERKEAVAHLEI